MRFISIVLAFTLLALARPGMAQPSGQGAATNPADPRAEVPPLPYKSPFAGYRPFAAGPVGPWKEVNDEVARIGGWKAYAREAYEASKQATPAAGEAGKDPAAPQESPGRKAK